MSPWGELGRFGAIGFEIAAAVGVGYAGGRWLDLHFETHGALTLLGLVLGIVASGVLLTKTAQQLKRATEKEERDHPSEPDDRKD